MDLVFEWSCVGISRMNDDAGKTASETTKVLAKGFNPSEGRSTASLGKPVNKSRNLVSGGITAEN